jgi:hypothetical protein
MNICCGHRLRVYAAPTYVYGDWGSNECPAGYVRITDASACETAATAMGKVWLADPTDTVDRPSGCFWNEEGGSNVFLNSHLIGSGYPRRLLLCTGAPIFRTRQRDELPSLIRAAGHASNA